MKRMIRQLQIVDKRTETIIVIIIIIIIIIKIISVA